MGEKISWMWDLLVERSRGMGRSLGWAILWLGDLLDGISRWLLKHLVARRSRLMGERSRGWGDLVCRMGMPWNEKKTEVTRQGLAQAGREMELISLMTQRWEE